MRSYLCVELYCLAGLVKLISCFNEQSNPCLKITARKMNSRIFESLFRPDIRPVFGSIS